MTDEQNKKTEQLKEWLKRAEKADKSVKRWRLCLERDRELARGKKGVSGSGTYNNSSVNSTENALIELAETERILHEKEEKFERVRDEIDSVIRKIEDDDLQEVLYWHYLKFLTWEKVAEEMDCSVSGIHYKHKKALKKLCSVLY